VAIERSYGAGMDDSDAEQRDDPGGGDPACWAARFGSDHDDLRGRDDVERLVRDFYRQAAMDDLLGSVFAAAHVDWNQHIERVTDFWMWQLFGERGYEGNPLRFHEPSHARTPFTTAHYARWVELFTDTIDERFAGPVADLAAARGRKMARALQRLLDGVSDDADLPTTVTVTRPPSS
jgi:hemoglobin